MHQCPSLPRAITTLQTRMSEESTKCCVCLEHNAPIGVRCVQCKDGACCERCVPALAESGLLRQCPVCRAENWAGVTTAPCSVTHEDRGWLSHGVVGVWQPPSEPSLFGKLAVLIGRAFATIGLAWLRGVATASLITGDMWDSLFLSPFALVLVGEISASIVEVLQA